MGVQIHFRRGERWICAPHIMGKHLNHWVIRWKETSSSASVVNLIFLFFFYKLQYWEKNEWTVLIKMKQFFFQDFLFVCLLICFGEEKKKWNTIKWLIHTIFSPETSFIYTELYMIFFLMHRILLCYLNRIATIYIIHRYHKYLWLKGEEVHLA